MKNLMKLAVLLLTLFLGVNSVSAQINYNDPRYAAYGPDAATREKNFMNYYFFGENMKVKKYDDAYARLDEILENSPQAHENLYINARTLLLVKIEGAKTPEEREMYVDKLIKVHDMRNQYYGSVPSRGSKVILAAKTLDHIQYDPKDVKNTIDYTDAAILASGPDVDLEMLKVFFNYVSLKYMNEEIDADVLLAQYDLISKAIAQSNTAEKEDVQKICDAIFIQSGAADCENIEKVYKPKYLAAKNDVELIKKILGYFAAGDCKSEFKNEVAEQYYAVNPTSSSAYMLAQEFEKSGNKQKSFKYYDEAIKLETDTENKSKFQLRLAVLNLVDGSASTAAKYAKDAIASDAQNGLAYFILAQAYGVGSSKTGCTGLQQKAIYWLIEDILIKARTLLAEDPEQVSKINQAISAYAPHFPTTEDIFYDSTIKEGGSYTVNCGWISGTTRVRAAK